MWLYTFYCLCFVLSMSECTRFLLPAPTPKFPAALKNPFIPLNIEDKQNKYGQPWERSGLFEGDIMMSQDDVGKNVLTDPSSLWTLPIPVHINPNHFNQQEIGLIERAITAIEEVTCVRFRQYQQGDPSFIAVESSGQGCWSAIGRENGGQTVNLQRPGCVYHGIVIHEFLHALGLFHQQSSPDRDNYVTIYWQNIVQGQEHNFIKHGTNVASTLNLPYDYDSLMHYGPTAFSVNGQPTITAVNNARIGQSRGMSRYDVEKIRILYGCANNYGNDGNDNDDNGANDNDDNGANYDDSNEDDLNEDDLNEDDSNDDGSLDTNFENQEE